jgi:hypothetical protein
MRLTANDILELEALCNELLDGTLDDARRALLLKRLSTSAPARQFYVRALAQSASLCLYATANAGRSSASDD